MTVNINAAFICKLVSAGPPVKRTQYRDSLLKGFLAVQHGSGRIAYYAQFARNRRKKVCEHPQITANQAREAVKAILAAAALGNPQLSRRGLLRGRRNSNGRSWRIFSSSCPGGQISNHQSRPSRGNRPCGDGIQRGACCND